MKENFFTKHKDLLLEFLRFLLVGGLATIFDWLVSFTISALFPDLIVGNWNIKSTIATICGFVVGLIINYILSVIFVYKNLFIY